MSMIPLFYFFIFRTCAFPDNMQCPHLLIFRLAQLCDLSLQRLSKLQERNVLQLYFYTNFSNFVIGETASRTKCVHATHERDGCTVGYIAM